MSESTIAMPTLGFEYRQDQLHCEETPLQQIAERFGTPCYVYSAQSIVGNYRAYTEALRTIDHEVHYSVKANGSLGVLALLVREGAGFDIVSGGELFRVLAAGGDPSKVVFSGVGKTVEEMDYALRSKVGCFNCESEDEVLLLNEMAGRLGVRAGRGAACQSGHQRGDAPLHRDRPAGPQVRDRSR